MRAVSDAGPLIHLSWIDRLDLPERLFEEVVLPPTVRDEVLAPPAGTLGLDRIQSGVAAGWLRVKAPTEASRLAGSGAPALDPGELAALLLAEEPAADLLISDDAPARAEAARRGLWVTGTVGVLSQAREQGLIPAVLPLLLELRRLGQWIGEDLVQAVRVEEAGQSSTYFLKSAS